ncbi:MAG: hypothetical protein R2867_08285 [Caldilineaceae bacterium]
MMTTIGAIRRWRFAGGSWGYTLVESMTGVDIEQKPEGTVRVTVQSQFVGQVDRALIAAASWQERLSQLHGLLSHETGEEQLQLLARQFSIDFAALPGASHSDRVQRLIEELDRQEKIYDLIQMLNLMAQGPLAARLPDFAKRRLAQAATAPRENFRTALVPTDVARFDCTLCYTIGGDGTVRIAGRFVPRFAELQSLPRLGLTMTLPATLEQFTWFGRGPQESYADRKEGAKVGRYGGTVSEQYVPYGMPQENGNKSDVRWATLTNAHGFGLQVTGDQLLNISAHHFTAADLTAAMHTHELQPRPEITLNVDIGQCGLGNASCGPGVLPQYMLLPEPTDFTSI